MPVDEIRSTHIPSDINRFGHRERKVAEAKCDLEEAREDPDVVFSIANIEAAIWLAGIANLIELARSDDRKDGDHASNEQKRAYASIYSPRIVTQGFVGFQINPCFTKKSLRMRSCIQPESPGQKTSHSSGKPRDCLYSALPTWLFQRIDVRQSTITSGAGCNVFCVHVVKFDTNIAPAGLARHCVVSGDGGTSRARYTRTSAHAPERSLLSA